MGFWNSLKRGLPGGRTRRLVEDLASGDFEVRFRAQDALAAIGAPAMPYLVAALRSTNFDVAFGASRALKRIRHPDILTLLKPILSAGGPSEREWALTVLGSVPGSTEVLLAALEDPLFTIRQAGMCSLLELGWHPATDYEKALAALSRDVRELVTKAELDGFNQEMRGLGPGAIELLSNAIKTARDWRVHRAAIGALCFFGNEAVLPALYEVVRTYRKDHEHDTGNVREVAALGIARIKALAQDSAAGRRPWQPPVCDAPRSPLVEVRAAKDLTNGEVVRVWHEQLERWATDWLEILDVVADLVILRNPATGEDVVRHVSATVPCWKYVS